MEWLVKHRVSRIGHNLDVNGTNGINDAPCLSPAGYSWGLTPSAYYLKAYIVGESTDEITSPSSKIPGVIWVAVGAAGITLSPAVLALLLKRKKRTT